MKLYVYRQYEYEGNPLFFLQMETPMTGSVKATILKRLDALYGNTDQETTDWALEYELWCRMLLCENALCLNPKHLDMGENNPLLKLLHYTLEKADMVRYMAAVADLGKIQEAAESIMGDSFEYP